MRGDEDGQRMENADGGDSGGLIYILFSLHTPYSVCMYTVYACGIVLCILPIR